MKEKLLSLYYFLLLLVFALWTNPINTPGLLWRLAFLLAVVFPSFFLKKEWIPLILLLFISIASYGYTSSFMPIVPIYHFVVLFVGTLFFRNKNKPDHFPLVLLFLSFYTFVIDAFTGGAYESISHASIMTLLCCFFIDDSDRTLPHVFSYVFILAALLMSYHFLILADVNTVRYGDLSSDLERTGFRDINYSASIVSMGILCAFIELFTRKRMKWYEYAFISFVVILSIICLLRNSSRTSLLALLAGLFTLILFSKVKTSYKIVITLILGLATFFFYTNGFLDLLLYRVANDDGTGSSRTAIWSYKWYAFFSESNLLNYLFGHGFQGGFNIGNFSRAFHNDFLAFLVDYGVIGLVFFIAFLIYPLRGRNNRAVVLSVMVFLLIVMLTLEPINSGRIPFYAMWLFMVYWGRNKYSLFEQSS